MALPGFLPANYVTGNQFTAPEENTVETTVNALMRDTDRLPPQSHPASRTALAEPSWSRLSRWPG